MNINLNKLIRTTNKLYNEQDLIQIEYSQDEELRITKGNVACFASFANMMEVLEVNKADLRNEDEVYDVLSKYFVNQLSASMGRKEYPEIVSIRSSFDMNR